MTGLETYTTDEFFSIAAAVDVLANATLDLCPKAFEDASDLLDTAPAGLLRGCAYLGWLLAKEQGIDRNADAARAAEHALAEITGLAARLIEIQDRAHIQRLLREREAGIEQPRAA